MCNNYGFSYVSMPVDKVMEQCHKLRDAIFASRKRSDDAYLNIAMARNKWRAKWFGWIGVRRLTREEMHISIMSNSSLNRFLSYPDFSCNSKLELVESVLKMSRSSINGKVQITAADYGCIFNSE